MTSKRTTHKSKAKQTTSRKLVVAEPLPVPKELLTAGIILDAEIEIDRQHRMEELKAKLLEMAQKGQFEQAIDSVLSTMITMERASDRLAWRVLRAMRYRFGRSTERLSRDELKQLFLAFGGDVKQAEAEAKAELPVPVSEQPEQVSNSTATDEPESEPSAPVNEQPKKKRNRVRSMKAAASVERNVTQVLVPAEQRNCAVCGKEMKSFGFVEHELFTFVPAKIVVNVEQREKLGCDCRQDAVTAPRTSAPAVHRKVDASLLAKLVRDKCALAQPLDRQRREFARMGLDIPDKTLQSYWDYTTDTLEPVAQAVLSGVFESLIVAADDSHLKTLTKGGKHGAFRGHIWCFVGTDGTVGGPETVAYGYTKSWDAAEIADWFASIKQFLQVDGYAGYSREVEDESGETRVAVPDDRRLVCGMHIRSKFHQALLAKDGRASIPLQYFSDIYAIESYCKQRNLTADQRLEERQRRSLSILELLDDWVDRTDPKLLPKSPLRRATTYAINQRPFFRRCFEDGRFEIDNGRCERRIRPFAVARRNFLFTGSILGGERLANAFTLVDNCGLLGIDSHAYLVDVITKIESGWPLRRLSELTPANWAAQHASK
ncbi:MAG: IS66 family transposase [Myxococcales bacterium]